MREIPAPRELATVGDFDALLEKQISTIDSIVTENIPKSKPSPHTKGWWSKELAQSRAAMCKLAIIRTQRGQDVRTQSTSNSDGCGTIIQSR